MRSTSTRGGSESCHPLPGAVIAVFVAAVLAACAGSAAPMLCIWAGVVCALALALLWRPGEPPTLLLAAVLQLLQTTAKLFYSVYLGVPLQSLAEYGSDLESATWVGLLSICSLVVGMWKGSCGLSTTVTIAAWREAKAWRPEVAFRLWLAVAVASTGFSAIIVLMPGLAQVELASAVQWAALYVLAFVTLVNRTGGLYVAAALAVHLLVGFTGYFAGFKSAFFPIIAAAGCVQRRFSAGRAALLLLSGALLFGLAVFWTAVKPDYRNLLNRGSGAQVVLTTWEQQVSFLAERFDRLTPAELALAADHLVKRVSYVDFLAATLEYVPKHRNHEGGALIGAAIAHILQPRFLFPEKQVLPSDSEATAFYTGIPVAPSGVSSDTSISIGYVGDLYIDFGLPGVVLGSLVLGWCFGRASKTIMAYPSPSMLINVGLAVMLMVVAMTEFERTLIKTVGSFVVCFLLISALQMLLSRWAGNSRYANATK